LIVKRNRLSDSDLQVSEICLGTMTWGEQNTEAEAHAQLDWALAHGINFAAGLLEKACRAAIPDARPAFIEFVQTFGDLVNFHPHVHVLAADGVFRADGAFVRLPAIPEALLEGKARRLHAARAALACQDDLRRAERHCDLPLQDALGTEQELPGHGRRRVAGAAL
jgi:hypothetical protein